MQTLQNLDTVWQNFLPLSHSPPGAEHRHILNRWPVSSKVFLISSIRPSTTVNQPPHVVTHVEKAPTLIINPPRMQSRSIPVAPVFAAVVTWMLQWKWCIRWMCNFWPFIFKRSHTRRPQTCGLNYLYNLAGWFSEDHRTPCSIKRQISRSLPLVNSPSLAQMCWCSKQGRAASLGLEFFLLVLHVGTEVLFLPTVVAMQLFTSHLPPDPDVLTSILYFVD